MLDECDGTRMVWELRAYILLCVVAWVGVAVFSIESVTPLLIVARDLLMA